MSASEDASRETEGIRIHGRAAEAEAGSSWPLRWQRRECVADRGLLTLDKRRGAVATGVNQSHLSIIIIDEHVVVCSVCAAIASDGGCARYPRKHEATRYQRPVDTAVGGLTEREKAR